MSKKIRNTLLFENGQTAAFDEMGQQVAELQWPTYMLWAERATALGYDISGTIFETELGKFRVAREGNAWVRKPI